MRDIVLYGHLGATFGKTFRMDVASPAEAIAALSANLRGFADYLRKHSAPGYKILIGDRLLQGEQELMAVSKDAPLRIVPVVGGASGAAQVILGAVLVVAGWAIAGFSAFTGWGGIGYTIGMSISNFGFAMIAGGVVNMIIGTPEVKTRERPETNPSYTFNGAVNTVAQGNPIPVAYGEVLIGSQVISAGITTDQMYVGYTHGGGGSGDPGDTSSDHFTYEK